MEALPESFKVQHDFSALVCSSVEALLESYGFQQRDSTRVPHVYRDFIGFLQRDFAQVPQVYRDFSLSRFPRHYLGMDDLPIKVTYPITSLMLFVHSHIVW
jgi:hypothetical protein